MFVEGRQVDMRRGWKLEPSERAALLARFPPAYPRMVADHVTYKPDRPDLPPPALGEIVGRADDGAGVEALVVRIDGTTDRPDGSTWHITWSLADGRAAKESNDVLAARGWAPVAGGWATLIPAGWD